MKTKVLFCLFSVFSLLSCVVASDSTDDLFETNGGICASNGKNVFYRDIKTGKTINLTEGVGADISGPFAVSENGKMEVWKENSDIKLRDLSSGEVCTLSFDTVFEKKSLFRRTNPDIAEGMALLQLSPEGNGLSFERNFKGFSWEKVPNTPYYNNLWMHQRNRFAATKNSPGVVITNMNLPLFMDKEDERNGVFALKIHSKKGEEYKFEHYYSVVPFGNFAEYVPVAWHRAIDSEKLLLLAQSKQTTPDTISGYASTPSWGPFTFCSLAQAIEKFSIKRNAYSGAWSKKMAYDKEQSFASLLQSVRGWTIDIRDQLHPMKINASKIGMKAGVYEIPIILPNNASDKTESGSDSQASASKSIFGFSLAWRHDDSLTLLAQPGGRVYVYDSEKIRQGRENSTTANEPSTIPGWRPITVPARNEFHIVPSLIAKGIPAKTICWVSEYAFIYRSLDDGNLYAWDRGAIKRVKNVLRVPDQYCYCSSAPPTPPAAKIVADSTKKVSKPKAIVVRRTLKKSPAKTFIAASSKPGVSFLMGRITFLWEITDDKKIVLNFKTISSAGAIGLAATEEKEISAIKDPSSLSFTESGSDGNVHADFEKVLVFRTDGRYIAIRPVQIDDNGLIVYEWTFLTRKTGDLAKADLTNKQAH